MTDPWQFDPDRTTRKETPMFAKDFNGRTIAEGSRVALIRLPWDGPQGTVQEIENGAAWVTFENAPHLDGWHRASLLT